MSLRSSEPVMTLAMIDNNSRDFAQCGQPILAWSMGGGNSFRGRPAAARKAVARVGFVWTR